MDRRNSFRASGLSAYAICALALATLAGCGGGGGGGGTSNSVVNSGTVPPPTINGTPPTQVTAGQAYSFTPSASGPSGSTLIFSVQNPPPWATFSTTTGALTGTPSSTNVGTFSDIVISVSDGSQSASLTAFSIQVAGSSSTASGTATLSWVPPTTNTNGTALTDVAGFIISYGTSPNELTQSITVANASATGYTVQNLAAGTWYFTVAVYTTSGTQSAPSGVASTTIS